MTALSSTDAEPVADGLPAPRLYWSVAAIALAIFMSVLDGAIANVALPSIARDLNATAASSIWVVNAYQLAITVCLLPVAALGDKLGYQRMYMAGIVIFTLASLACALSQTLGQLTAARVVQGVGASGVMSINAALVRYTWPSAKLGRGIGFNAVIISLASAAGPTIASAILAAGSWQWLFAVNVPIGLASIAIGLRALPRTEGSGKPFDAISALLNALTFGFLIMGAESLAREGLTAGLIKLAIGAVAAVFLVRRELPRQAPLVPFDLLRIPLFGLSIATSITSFLAQMLAFIALPFLMMEVLGRTAVETGLLMTPWPLAVGVAAPIAGRLADRYPAGLLGGIGMALFSLGLGLLAFLPHDASNLDIIWRMALAGIGFGFFQSPNNRTLVTAAPRNRSGAAGGMLATARLLGQTTGAVVVAVLFHVSGPHASAVAIGAGAVVAALAAVVSLMRLKVAPPGAR